MFIEAELYCEPYEITNTKAITMYLATERWSIPVIYLVILLRVSDNQKAFELEMRYLNVKYTIYTMKIAIGFISKKTVI